MGLRKGSFKQRVAIVHPFPYLDSIPSLCNAALLLSQHGFGVDIFTQTNPYFEKPSFEDDRIQLFMHKERRSSIQRFIHPQHKERKSNIIEVIRRSLRGLSEVIKPFIPLTYLLFLLNPLIAMDRIRDTLTIWHRHRKCPYRCFIGVDPAGLVQAQRLSVLIDVPLVYWSLELLLSYELQNNAQRVLKRKEITLSRKTAFIIIQDKDRARLLAEDNGLSFYNFVFAPNAPLGSARRRRLNYWHQHFGLPQHRKVVLHAGSLGDWTGISEVVASVPSWPEDWVLVIHTRFDAHQSQEIEKLQRRADSGRVFLSLHPASRKDYDNLVDSANIGIAFYVPVQDSASTQENIRSLGLSSGKIAYYLRSGLPVIVNEGTSGCNLIKQESCGVIVANAQGIGEAIEQIAGCYEEYSANACRSFDKNMDFTCSFQHIIKRIENL